MRKIITTLALFFIICNAYSQVGGLSASKLGTYCAETVPVQSLEFEPTFNFASTTSYFNEHNNVSDLFMSDDSIQHFASTGFRFTYGLFENFELGVTIPIDISTISFGINIKYQLIANLSLDLWRGIMEYMGMMFM